MLVFETIELIRSASGLPGTCCSRRLVSFYHAFTTAGGFGRGGPVGL